MGRYNYDNSFADKVSHLCCNHYTEFVKKTGKPQSNKEWTVLAAVVVERCANGSPPELRVVALGTGSKCLGQSKLNDRGDLIHDSHAEVIARRSFIRFLYSELERVYNGDNSDYIKRCTAGDVKCQIKPGIHFHFFTSHTPCGDAAIFPLTAGATHSNVNDLIGEAITSHAVASDCHKRHLPERAEDGCRPAKSSRHEGDDHCKSTTTNENIIITTTGSDTSANCDKSQTQTECSGGVFVAKRTNDANLDNVNKYVKWTDTHRTGAKCVGHDGIDPELVNDLYHVTRVLRTKPGRGDRTLSMSCSDKLSLWNLLGIQGALISILINEPIYLDTITVGKCLFNLDALRRAILERTKPVEDLPVPYHQHNVIILHASHTFEHSRETAECKSQGMKTGPSPASVIWWLDGAIGQQEASVNGRKQGVVSKNWNKPIARCSICPYELFKQFYKLTKKMTSEMKENIGLVPVSDTYHDYKACALQYQKAKKAVLKLFNTWKRTPPEYYRFTITD